MLPAPGKGEQTYEGESRVYYQSGLAFIGLTPEQRRKLAVALEILKTSGPEDPAHPAGDDH